MHSRTEQPAQWRRAEQYGGGWAGWHHAGIIDYCPVTMAEEEKQIRLCVIVCTWACVYDALGASGTYTLEMAVIKLVPRPKSFFSGMQIVRRANVDAASIDLNLELLFCTCQEWRLFSNLPIILLFSTRCFWRYSVQKTKHGHNSKDNNLA